MKKHHIIIALLATVLLVTSTLLLAGGLRLPGIEIEPPKRSIELTRGSTPSFSNVYYNVGDFTNALCVVTNYTPDTVEYMIEQGALTNVVKRLATEGYICTIFGHQWRAGRPGEGEGSEYGGFYLDYHPNTIYRTCRFCGSSESRSIGWGK